MIRNLIVLAILLLFGSFFYRCTVSTSDTVWCRRNPGGGYYFFYRDNRVWINPSLREGSLSGSYRGGGPHAGK